LKIKIKSAPKVATTTTANFTRVLYRTFSSEKRRTEGSFYRRKLEKEKRRKKSSATGIPTWSPTVVLTGRYDACLPQSGRDAKFSSFCGRTHLYAFVPGT